MANATGRVVQILGGVVDVEFPEGQIPELFEAISVDRPGNEPLILEVQKHLGDNWVRTVSMDATDGLQRGVPAVATGSPIMVPVGPSTLGRIFNVLGKPVDNKGDVCVLRRGLDECHKSSSHLSHYAIDDGSMTHVSFTDRRFASDSQRAVTY